MGSRKAFTIVELLIAMVVIGIIAAITIISYAGITDKAKAATIQADLKNASTVLKLYNAEYGAYPTQFDANLCPSAPTASTNYCLKLSSGISINNYAASTLNYTLGLNSTSNSSTCYQITSSSNSPTSTCSSSSGYNAEQLLSQATWWIDSAYSTNGQTITNLGSGGSALNAQSGSTATTDTSDPKYLDYTGTPYIYLPGVSGNSLSISKAAAGFSLTTELDFVAHLNKSWTGTGSNSIMIGCYGGSSGAGLMNNNSNGLLTFTLYDGTSYVGVNATQNTYGVGPKWVRVTWRSSDGRVQFFFNDDQPNVPTSWNQLGADLTLAQGKTIGQNVGYPYSIGGSNSGWAEMQVLYGSISTTINGPPELIVDTSSLSSGSQTTLTAKTGQTVNIDRSASGRKSSAVVSPAWLMGTDDYINVTDNDLINFGASQDFTVMAVGRRFGNAAASSGFITKGAYGANGSSSYVIEFQNASSSIQSNINNYPPMYWYSNGGVMSGSTINTATLSRSGANVFSYLNGSSLGVCSTGCYAGDFSLSLSNTSPLRIGANSSGGYADLEFVAGAVFRRALTPSEITTITNYYNGRFK